MRMNKVCMGCDYVESCHKRIRVDGQTVYVKDLEDAQPTCLNKVQEICRDCLLFKHKRCASWAVFNGKKLAGVLKRCPKKQKAKGV